MSLRDPFTRLMVLVPLVLVGCDASVASEHGALTPTGSDPAVAMPKLESLPNEVPAPVPAGSSVATPASSSPYPVVFLHGMGGVENLGLGPLGEAYWPKVIPSLKAAGEARVFATEVSPFNGSDVRAAEVLVQLQAILLETGASKLNLVGHSQGGLDARVLASPNGLRFAEHIASITTISTPHRGSPVADLALVAVPGGFVDAAVSGVLGILQRSGSDLQTDPKLRAQLLQLSVRYMNEVFNPAFPDAEGVRYESYAGRSNLQPGFGICDGAALPNAPWELDAVEGGALPTATFLEIGIPPKPNDGLVTVESAKWGTFVQCVPADHTDEVGRGTSRTFEHTSFYRRVVARIRSNGF